jgi:sugar/nucleoside kinase (ribokinase family)
MMKKYDVLVIGELNVDLILNEIESFPEMGKEKISRKMSLVMGSSSAIFACNMASLGNRIGFIGKIGNDDFGNVVLKNLEAKNVDSSLIIKSNTVNTGATIVLNYDQDRAMVTYPGAMEELVSDDIPFNEFKNARHLHLSSFFLQAALKKDITKIFKRAKEEGMTTSMDIQWDPEEKWDFNYKETLPYIDVFLPNEAEIKAITGSIDPLSAIHELKKYARIIAVKSGEKGSFLWKEGNLVHKKAYSNNQVVDAIGAGDSFNAGFIHKFLKGRPETACLDFANLTGAISTTASGGTAAFENIDQIMETARTMFNYEG